MRFMTVDQQHKIVRSLTFCVGVCSVAWTIFSNSAAVKEAVLDNLAKTVLLGEVLSDEQMHGYWSLQTSRTKKPLSSRALFDDVVVRLRLLEESAKSERAAPPEVAKLNHLVSNALALGPTNSFLWLAQYWLGSQDIADRDQQFRYLRMSYSTGPREAWIAIKRNPITLQSFSSMPQDLSDHTVSEFVGLVGSGFYSEAASILAGPGWDVRNSLLGKLVVIDAEGRRRFAAVLAAKNVEGVFIPGVEEKSSRPF